MHIDQAIQEFVLGYSSARSITRPSGYERWPEYGAWIVRDPPTTRRIDPRNSEIIMRDVGPDAARQIARDAGLGRHFVCVLEPIEASVPAMRARYRAGGFRTLRSEALFVHDMLQIPDYQTQPPVHRILDPAEVELVRKGVRRAPLTPADLRDDTAQRRLYAKIENGMAIGWVTSIPSASGGWVSNLAVRPEFRGRGIGRALMSQMLQDDRQHGVVASVLLASQAGARLYPHLGYRQIGTLQLFSDESQND